MLKGANPRRNDSMLSQPSPQLKSKHMQRKCLALAQKWDHVTAKCNSNYCMGCLQTKIKLSHLNESPQTTMRAQPRPLLSFRETWQCREQQMLDGKTDSHWPRFCVRKDTWIPASEWQNHCWPIPYSIHSCGATTQKPSFIFVCVFWN